MAMAMTIMGAAVLSMPTARPVMIVVAGPVWAAAAMLCTGLFSLEV